MVCYVKRRYLLDSKYPIPAALVWIIASWAISLAAFTLLGLSVWMVWGQPHHNLLDSSPRFVTVLFGVWGIYTGIGAMSLWIAMWIFRSLRSFEVDAIIATVTVARHHD